MTDTATTEQVDALSVDEVYPNPSNPRSKIGDLRELRRSIASSGILEPLLVRPIHVDTDTGPEVDHYQIVAGHRRHAAAIAEDLGTVPCIIREMTDDQADEAMLIENLQRVDLNPVEEARGYFLLIERNHTVAGMAKRLGRSKKHIAGRLALLDLPGPVLAKVEAGDIPLGQAPALRGLYDDETPIPDETREQVIDAVCNGHDAERLVDEARSEVKRALLLDKVVEKVQARGLAYAVQDGWSLPEEAEDWKIIGDGYEQLAIDDVKAHDKLDCARILIRAMGGRRPEALRACANPKAHTTKRAEKDGGLPAADYERKAEERARIRKQRAEERERAAAYRRQQARALSGMSKTEAVDILVRHSICGIAQADVQEVARILELEPDERESQWEKRKDGSLRIEKDWVSPVYAYAHRSGAAALRVAVAAAMVRPGWAHDEEISTAPAVEALVGQFSAEPEPEPEPEGIEAADDDA